MADLFSGDGPLTEADLRKAFRKNTPRGYAWHPGTGPDGETCGTCRHLVRNRMSRTYFKCRLNQSAWTSSPRTDVLSRSPACLKWESAHG